MRSCLVLIDVSSHLLLRGGIAESGNSQRRTYHECSASFPVNSPVQHISTPVLEYSREETLSVVTLWRPGWQGLAGLNASLLWRD